MSLTQGFPNTFTGQVTNQVTKNHENELRKIYTDINSIMSTHAHTGSGSDGALIDNSAITGVSTGTAVPATNKTLWELKWSEKFILNSPPDAYVSPNLPLTRNGTMATMDFHVQGTPASATTVTVKQGATTVGSVSLSAAGKTTLTFGTAVTGVTDDLFTYTLTGAGLSGCNILCNQKWVNR